MRSYLLTPRLVKQAIDGVLPPAMLSLQTGAATDRDSVAYMVLYGPTNPDALHIDQSLIMVKDEVRGATWKDKYRVHAYLKALMSLRTGLPSRKVIVDHPEMLQCGDTIYPGSYVDGWIITSVSGYKPDEDEEISRSINCRIRELLTEAVKKAIQASETGLIDNSSLASVSLPQKSVHEH